MAKSHLAAISIAFALTTMLGGCVSDNDVSQTNDVAPEPPAPSDSVEEQLVIPEGVSARGVVLAALLLANGDITRAVEEALVSPEEVEIAREAIASDTLQLWVDEASKS